MISTSITRPSPILSRVASNVRAAALQAAQLRAAAALVRGASMPFASLGVRS